jgi:hypothetical protein
VRGLFRQVMLKPVKGYKQDTQACG